MKRDSFDTAWLPTAPEARPYPMIQPPFDALAFDPSIIQQLQHPISQRGTANVWISLLIVMRWEAVETAVSPYQLSSIRRLRNSTGEFTRK